MTLSERRPRRLPEPEVPSGQKIDKLCSVLKPPYRGAGMIYIGWTTDGKPTLATGEDGLTPAAVENVQTYLSSRLQIKEASFRPDDIIPVEYVFTGTAVDFKDQGGAVAEDIVNIGFRDGSGQSKTIAFGELALLKAICSGKTVWQDTSNQKPNEVTVDPKSMYTLFVPQPKSSTAFFAVLFKPTIPGESNEPVFKSFIRKVISRLLVVDESQPPRNRKGYVQAAIKIAGSSSSGGGLLDSIIELDGGTKAMFLKGLRALGFIDISNERIDDIRNTTLGTYDIENIDLDTLLSLAAEMYNSVRHLI